MPISFENAAKHHIQGASESAPQLSRDAYDQTSLPPPFPSRSSEMSMVRTAARAMLFCMLVGIAAHVEADEPRSGRNLPVSSPNTPPSLCPELTQKQIDLILQFPQGISRECRRQMKGRGCGKLGGTGYRSPKRECVGYRDLIKTCGEKPHTSTGCVCEGVALAPGCSRPTINDLRVKKRGQRKRIAPGSPAEFGEPAQLEKPLRTEGR